MDENNKKNKVGFWPTSWIGSNWSQITWTEKLKRITPLFIFLLIFIFVRLTAKTIIDTPQMFNIFLGVVWVLILLGTVWVFKQKSGTGNKNTVGARIIMVVISVFFFFYILGHYLGYF